MHKEKIVRMTAAQHVYGVLTREQSPKGQGGFQTFLYTSELLTQDEVRLLERRAKYSSSQGEKAKWQYYRLPGQRPVISRIIPIPEPDEFGRQGRYLAHSLVFSASDWQQLDDAPFDLLRPEHFFSSLGHVLACDGFRTGKAPVVPVETKMGWSEEAMNLVRAWSGEQLNRLVMLVSDPQRMTEQGHYVALVGNDTQILDALKVTFLLAPSSVRKSCSFDTNSSGCEWQRDVAFWGRGFPVVREASSCFVIDAVQQQVKIPESSSLQPSAYGTWIEAVVTAQKYTGWLGNLERAQALAALLEGHLTDLKLLRGMEAEFESSFANANAALFEKRVANFLPEQLSPALRETIIARLSQPTTKLLRWLIDTQHTVFISEPTYQALLSDCNLSLTVADLELLSPLAKIHRGLGLLLALKSGSELQRLQMLAAMSLDEYKQRVRELQTRSDFKAWQVFSPTYMYAWFNLCQGSYSMEDIVRGISSVAEHGSKQDQQQVAHINNYLEPDQRQRLQQWLKSSSHRLSELQSALDKSVSSTEGGRPSGRASSVWQRLRHPFTRRSGRS